MKLHSDKINKTKLYLNIYETDKIKRYNHIMHTTTEKYDNNGKGLYFRFDDDKMNYICAIHI